MGRHSPDSPSPLKQPHRPDPIPAQNAVPTVDQQELPAKRFAEKLQFRGDDVIQALPAPITE